MTDRIISLRLVTRTVPRAAGEPASFCYRTTAVVTLPLSSSGRLNTLTQYDDAPRMAGGF